MRSPPSLDVVLNITFLPSISEVFGIRHSDLSTRFWFLRKDWLVVVFSFFLKKRNKNSRLNFMRPGLTPSYLYRKFLGSRGNNPVVPSLDVISARGRNLLGTAVLCSFFCLDTKEPIPKIFRRPRQAHAPVCISGLVPLMNNTKSKSVNKSGKGKLAELPFTRNWKQFVIKSR